MSCRRFNTPLKSFTASSLQGKLTSWWLEVFTWLEESSKSLGSGLLQWPHDRLSFWAFNSAYGRDVAIYGDYRSYIDLIISSVPRILRLIVVDYTLRKGHRSVFS